ncbi:MAG: family 10 glycosylhydrolase [Ignavibacteriales bacterium]|nr:family 10 glycosylhydrolase [Ignavibacteriales bacterium]
MKKILLLVMLLSIIRITAQDIPPTREFRGVWIASVANLDWPLKRTYTTQEQQDALVSMLDSLKLCNINAVFFQVRPECDALYISSIEPWSYWLTNSQGTPPNPLWDPLEFAIQECRKRGMEIHAWLNPYRAVRNATTYSQHASHITNTHPEWILTFNNLKILNPGIPNVWDYNISVIVDIVNRYDVDGIHFDDYFYPYPPDQITYQDTATFSLYNRGIADIGDWRRDNVNTLMQMIHDTIKVLKPWVKFGISPFGIWKNGVPTGITGMDAYNVIFADPIAWLKDKSVDYIIPQLYWQIGGGQDYSKLMPWWADSVHYYGRHYFVGHPFYKTSPKTFTGGLLSRAEMSDQIRLNRANDKCQGSTFFQARNFPDNYNNVTDSIMALYQYDALIPVMEWGDTIPPNEPYALTFGTIPETSTEGLMWSAPPAAVDGDTAMRYVIYYNMTTSRFTSLSNDATFIIDITGNNYYEITPQEDTYYYITALDRNNNESTASDMWGLDIDIYTNVPYKFDLAQNYPNPFNPSTKIKFTIPESGNVKLTVYNLLGQEITTLVNSILTAGHHEVEFNAENLSSGLYIYRLESSGNVAVRKMIFLK